MEVVEDQGDEAFYDRLDSAYPTDDEDTEVYVIFSFHFLEPLIFLLNKSQSNILYYPIFPSLLQEEGDEPYLETYYSENEGEDGGDSSTCNLQSETFFL